MRKMLCLLLCLYVVVFPVMGARAGEAVVKQYDWAAGLSGGEWYVMAAGVAQLIEEHAPKVKIRVIPGGGTQNSITVGDNKTEFAFGMPSLVLDAAKGRTPYQKQYEDIRAIANGFSYNFYHLLAAADTGVKTFDDFMKYPRKDIRIDVTKKGSSGEDIFNKILTGYMKSSYKELQAAGAKLFFTDYTTISTNMQDKHIDFTGINIIPPASLVQELSIGRKLNIIPLPKELQDFMQEEYGYGVGLIKKEAYPGVLMEDVPTITTGTMAMCHKDVDEETVYQVTKILCENSDRLVNISKNMASFNPEEAHLNMPVPLHPGAEKYYREKGYIK